MIFEVISFIIAVIGIPASIDYYNVLYVILIPILISKVVIIASGFGTRFLSATKS